MVKSGFISIIRNRIFKILLILLALLPVTAFAHYVFFPQETRSILIDFSGFIRDGRVYFNRDTKRSCIDSLECLIRNASIRVNEFWGSRKADPKFIYCNKEDDFEKYSVSPGAPAVTYCKWGTYIVLSEQGVNLDIIAHELSHAELFARIGFYNWTYVIPDWFKHGLAMQNDHRSYYSTDTLRARTNNFKKMPDIKQFKTSAQFYDGTLDQVMLRYMVAKYEVARWYSREKLNQLIKNLNSGKSFDESFLTPLPMGK